jgi:lipopolysaccharide export system protein LptA
MAALAVLHLALAAPANDRAAVPSTGTPSAAAKKPAPGTSPRSKAKPGTAPATPPTHVQAATADYDYKRRRTIMTGAPLVVLTREDATLVCKKLVADDDESGQIRHATCDGDVKLTRADRVVTCQHATYEASTGKVVCVGDPVLKDGDSVIHCEQAIYELDTDKVWLKQPKGILVQKPGQQIVRPKSAAASTPPSPAPAQGNGK